MPTILNTFDNTEENATSWVNGVPASCVSISDRGLAYGDGVFETIRVGRSPVLFEQHLDRLSRGVSVLSIPVELSLLRQEILLFLQGRRDGVLKVIVTHGEGGRGYASPAKPEPSRILSWHPLPVYPDWYYSEGVSLYPCHTTLGQNSALAGIKHLNRLEQVLARNEWGDQDFQEGLMCDEDGSVIEAVFSNVWCVKDSCLITPYIKKSGVAGVMREWLLMTMREQAIVVEEKEILHADIMTMDEVFLSNSVFGVWPVKCYNNMKWVPGPVARQCQQLISDQLF